MYGIKKKDIAYCQAKIDKQVEFNSSHSFLTANGEVKTYLEVSMSANISQRYYAQLINKVNSLQQIMSHQNLEPIFITLTLDGVFHNLLNADYSRFTAKNYDLLPNNDRFGYLKDLAVKRRAFSVKDLYKLLRYQWHNFQRSYTYMQLKKKYNLGYLFAVEPHKSGVPHAHVLLYAPRSSFISLRSEFEKCFKAPQNLKKTKITPLQKKNGELNGFQWSLSNPVGYILKYCTKSFINLKEGVKLDDLQSWYIKHKIVRISTSRSLIPQWVYNKMYAFNSDWYYLSTLKLNASCEWSREDNFFQVEDKNLDIVYKFDNGLYQKFYKDKKILEFGAKMEKEELKSYRYYAKPTLKSLKPRPFISYEDWQRNKPISKYSDYELLDYYKNLNIENEEVDLKHFGVVQNECVNRGLISGKLENLNDYNLEIGA